MAAAIQCTFFPATESLSSSTLKQCRRIDSHLSTSFFKPISSSKRHSFSSNPRLVISQTKLASSRCGHRIAAVAGLADRNSETYPEAEVNDSNVGASIDTKLPRRSLLVQFTCGECGGRTQRLINRLAYEQGTVYVQCAGCERYHKLVDNLGLVIEYDLREEMTEEMDTDQVP
ncbi:uncharacterized protein [Euphorbia lathyris]|uniref:uncharacterized protein n=1 Tax=Euphorbia lathyris TaxID=212925 RepID=UPI0033138C52